MKGHQQPSDLPIFMDEVRRHLWAGCGEPSWVGAGRAGGHQQRGLVFPFVKKAPEGDMRGQIFVPLITTAARGLAGPLVDALWALGEASLVSPQTLFMSPVQMPSPQEPLPEAL